MENAEQKAAGLISQDTPNEDNAIELAVPTTEDSSEAVVIEQLEDRIAQLQQRLAIAESRALIRTQAALKVSQNQLVFTGELTLPLLDKDSVVLSFELSSDAANRSTPVLIEIPVRKLPPASSEATLQWSATVDMSRISAHGKPAVGDRYYGRLIVERLGLRAGAVVQVQPDASAARLVFSKVLDKSHAFSVGEYDGEPLLTVVDCEAGLAEPLTYTVDSLRWEKREMVVDLLLNHPLANSNIFEVAAGLELEGVEQDAGPLPIAVRTSYRDRESLLCQLRFVPEVLIPEKVGVDQRLHYLVTLAYHCMGQPEGRRLDLFVENPDIDCWEAETHQVISKNRFIKPVIAGGHPLGFEVETVAHGLTEPIALRVEDLEWTEGNLGMYGTVTQRLENLKGFSCRIVLIHGDGEKRYIPWKLTKPKAPDRHQGRDWSTAFHAATILGGLKAGTWQFALEKRYGPLSAVEPFALKRHDGLLEKFVQKIIRTGNEYWLPVEIANGIIGFRTIDASSVSETAEPRITHVEWVGDGKLSLSGTAHHPLTSIGGLRCSLMLQSVSSGSVNIPLRSVVANDGTIAWQADFEPAVLLADKNPGLWYLTFAKRFDLQFDSEILVNAAGPESSERLMKNKLPRSIRIIQGVGGSIGFEVRQAERKPAPEKRKRRFFRR